MRSRQNLVIALVFAFVVAIFGWTQMVTPEKSKVTEAESKVSTAHQQLAAAQASLSQARQAQEKYATAYASIVELGKAVPAQYEVPALIYEIEKATNLQHVQITSIAPGAAGSSGSTSTSGSTASAGQPSSFAAMPITFAFTGTFANLYHLLVGLQGLNSYSASGGVTVNGRLLTIQSVDLAPSGSSSSSEVKGASKSNPSNGELTGTINATAYVLPQGQGLTAGASASGPAGTSSSAGSGTGSAVTPATIKAVP